MTEQKKKYVESFQFCPAMLHIVPVYLFIVDVVGNDINVKSFTARCVVCATEGTKKFNEQLKNGELIILNNNDDDDDEDDRADRIHARGLGY